MPGGDRAAATLRRRPDSAGMRGWIGTPNQGATSVPDAGQSAGERQKVGAFPRNAKKADAPLARLYHCNESHSGDRNLETSRDFYFRGRCRVAAPHPATRTDVARGAKRASRFQGRDRTDDRSVRPPVGVTMQWLLRAEAPAHCALRERGGRFGRILRQMPFQSI